MQSDTTSDSCFSIFLWNEFFEAIQFGGNAFFGQSSN